MRHDWRRAASRAACSDSTTWAMLLIVTSAAADATSVGRYPRGSVGLRIVDGHADDRLPAVRELFAEYAASLEVDLSFQDFERELAELPGDYVPPAGRLLLALDGEAAAGCVALRAVRAAASSEMKRLYVRPAFQGTGLGRRLAEAIVEAGREAGYESMRLDTLPTMATARGLYRSSASRRSRPTAPTRSTERRTSSYACARRLPAALLQLGPRLREHLAEHGRDPVEFLLRPRRAAATAGSRGCRGRPPGRSGRLRRAAARGSRAAASPTPRR